MGRYDLDEYEEYEDEGEYQEEDVGEEEEDHPPTKEELEYLHLRQKLKESIRKKMKKDLSSGLTNSKEKKSKMPYDKWLDLDLLTCCLLTSFLIVDFGFELLSMSLRIRCFGSFFGPSKPVIAQRVIQESKSLLENPHLAARVSKAKNVQNKGGASTPVVSKPQKLEQHREVINLAKPKAKIQMLRDTRDYSFLLSEADLPAPTKNPPKSLPATKPVINGGEDRKMLPKVSQMRVKAGPSGQKPSTASKLNSTSLEPRKQLGRNDGSGSARPSAPKTLPLKAPMVRKEKVISASVAKGSMPSLHKPLHSKPAPSVHKKPVAQKRDDRESSKGNVIAKKPVLSSKPQIKQQPAKLPPSAQQKERLKKRPVRSYSDDEHDDRAISMIRSMFRYNPSRYRGVNDDDDSDMEAGFDDIMMEEKRSARIAAKEDEEELRKIEEEERRERMRKAAKKRKLNQR
ncbi:uncharacterized protein LOC112522937 isoform X2 [Cynara cardunculus var. scolymus]|uniref:uncharacterized protein LOC112522937 isoform X2 n=1 Tax=Cynara cardunculus var. scolymus TaxID=59895 RepID=UPI000D62F463|nr:uncharacterized protein LOC112522937 isoform X2 [Cynara cardunculus var. scolymus]